MQREQWHYGIAYGAETALIPTFQGRGRVASGCSQFIIGLRGYRKKQAVILKVQAKQ